MPRIHSVKAAGRTRAAYRKGMVIPMFCMKKMIAGHRMICNMIGVALGVGVGVLVANLAVNKCSCACSLKKKAKKAFKCLEDKMMDC